MDYNDVIKAMTNDQLTAMREANADNASVVGLIDGILEARAKELDQQIANAEFAKGVDKLVGKLAHPDNVGRVLLRWGKYEVEQGEPEMVDVPQPDGSTITESRVPKFEVEGWMVEVNPITKLGASGASQPSASKRAITIYKHNPDGADENKGNFTSYQKFATSEGIVVGGDSARRAVERGGFYGVPYDGTDVAS